eukprot:9469227-Pyramimonas_sp.AAC.1
MEDVPGVAGFVLEAHLCDDGDGLLIDTKVSHVGAHDVRPHVGVCASCHMGGEHLPAVQIIACLAG